MSTSVTWKGLNETRELLRGMVKKTEQRQKLMDSIGSKMVSSTQTRIADEKTSPAGQKWQGYKHLAYAHRKAKQSSGGLLVHSNQLVLSISHKADRKKVEWGSNKAYAARHQFGGSGIPARPFLGVSNKDNLTIKNLIKQYYDKR